MADDPFDAHRASLEDFEETLADLCLDIVEASYDTENAYYKTCPDTMTGIYAAPPEYVANLDMPTPYDFDNEYFSHTVYRDDVAQLANGDLTMFLDEANPSQFDDVIAALGEAAKLLELAAGYDGLEVLRDLLGGWQGEAAYNFQHDVIPKCGASIVYQLMFIEELIAVTKCLQEVVLRCRADGLGLAQELLDRVTVPEMPVDLESVLWVAGAVAAGIATFGALMPVGVLSVAATVGFTLSTTAGGLGQVARLTGEETGERAIKDGTAYDFVPSAVDQVQLALGKGIDEVEVLMDALKGDLDSDDMAYLVMSKPKIIDGTEMSLVDEENLGEEVLIESIADLRFAGAVTLPVMAEFFDKAYGQVEVLKTRVAAGLGSSHVADTPSIRHLPTAIDLLAEAFMDSRNYLYEAGVALTDMADAYFDNEEQRQAVMDNFAAQLGEHDEELFPAYTPPPPPADYY